MEHVCLFVCLFVGWLVRYARFYFSKTASHIFMKFGTDAQQLHQMSLLSIERSRSRSTFKVTTQRTINRPSMN